MRTILIGIHGLRNKPPKYLLTKWWKRSIIEGFRIIHLPVPRVRLEIAYWAHFMHEKSQNPSLKDPGHPQFLPEPYVPCTAFGPKDPRNLRSDLKHAIHQQILQLIAGKSGFMNINAVSDAILHRMFVELETYYHHKLRDEDGRMRPAKELIREVLARLLRKHRDKTIMLLAHSMGSIIAYDVLLHEVPDIPIHTFLTFGSPLGFPVIMKQIKQELGRDQSDPRPLPTPENIRCRWLNFSDFDDVTCLNYNLRAHYAENSRGCRPFDQITYNTYEWNGVANPHKCYGYLRTAEITDAINRFLTLETAGVWERIKWVFKRPKM
jgi:hypothetical protein